MGRSIFILGIINGVLGIQLVGDDPNSANIVYAVIAALAFVIYTSIIVKWYIQRHRMRKQLGKGEYEDSKGSEPEMSGGAVI